MITLRLGEARISIDAGALRGALMGGLAKLLSLGDDTPEGVLFQIGVSKFSRLILWYMRHKGAKTPEVPKKADATPYLLSFFADAILTDLQAREWECRYVEADSGDIEITGVAPVAEERYPLSIPPPPDMAPGGTVAPDGDSGADITGDSEAPAAPADPDEPGGSLATARNVGQRQDDGGHTDSGEPVPDVAGLAEVLC